ncbi:MAG: hypothetical protein OER88_13980, partial [Planctomycetota bacterium]|nr:hypothetical protein [Planctomycetota bacterium]
MKRSALILILAVGVHAEGEAPNLAVVKPPAAKVSVDEAVRTGVEFLVKNQNKDGSFGHHVSGRTRELWCDVPGGHLAFRGASTALCWLGLNDAPYQTDASRAAQERCLKWLVKHGAVKRAYQQQFYNIWPYGYGLRALGQALNKKAPGAEPEAIKATMRRMIKGLTVLQSPEGGWSYLDFRAPLRKPTTSNSFTSATVMLGLFEAQKAGVEVPKKMIERATRYMWTTRTPTGNYTYSHGWRMRPAGLINLAQGSSMRNTACNLALHLYDAKKMDQAQLRRGLKQLVKHHRFAIIALRRPRPHESHYAV